MTVVPATQEAEVGVPSTIPKKRKGREKKRQKKTKDNTPKKKILYRTQHKKVKIGFVEKGWACQHCERQSI
jgi:hypothetical protein